MEEYEEVVYVEYDMFISNWQFSIKDLVVVNGNDTSDCNSAIFITNDKPDDDYINSNGEKIVRDVSFMIFRRSVWVRDMLSRWLQALSKPLWETNQYSDWIDVKIERVTLNNVRRKFKKKEKEKDLRKFMWFSFSDLDEHGRNDEEKTWE